MKKVKRFWKMYRNIILKRAGETITFICASLCFLFLHGIETDNPVPWVIWALICFTEVMLYGYFIAGWMDDIRDDHKKHRRKRL